MPFGVEVDKKTLAAVGVGVLVGAGSAMVFSYLARMRTNPPHALHERPATVRDLAMLQDTVEKLKEEVVGLRERLASSSGGRRRRARENSGFASVTSGSEYMSVTSGDDDEDDGGYMTPPDTDSDVAAVTFDEGALQLSELEASLVRVDTLHNGSLQNKEEAYNMLLQLKEKHSGSAEVLCRVGKASAAFNQLGKLWRNKKLSLKTKMRFYNSNVLSTLLTEKKGAPKDELATDSGEGPSGSQHELEGSLEAGC
ncbi:PREDICTED: regulator of microtubule dynamics protein 3-like [Branchiostoma belcheri]|uniref:Regulator of microtubule dynamics protein 3-like n=1 Tax=Branchiostoma belcheri TaxID=7741 RepID=A0A6P5AG88_BRABE|nr:PREDICTED: regulator of microtubule dynamics protein 3-like [Branchiostoma belcheri]